MEAAKPLVKASAAKLRQALELWLDGFREVCCLHRVVILCLGIFILNSFIIPILHGYYLINGHGLVSQNLALLVLFWFYPFHIFSFILSTIWYNDIAKYGLAAMGRPGPTTLDPHRQNEASLLQSTARLDRPSGLGGVMIGIGEQACTVLLLTFFFIEVYATGSCPMWGRYKFSEVSLHTRLDFFESNWAFFSGFGSPCVLAIFFFSPLVSYGVMAILFPLAYTFSAFFFLTFVLIATSSGAEQDISSQGKKWRRA